MKAKALRQRTVTASTIAESLYERVKASQSQPQFADSAQALREYSKRLKEVAAQRKQTVEQMVVAIDGSGTWSDEDREVMRMSRLITALSAQ